MPQARHADENAAVGRHRAEELSIEAPPGPCGAPVAWVLGVSAPGTLVLVVVTLKLEVRRQAKLYPGIRRRSLTDSGSAQLGATLAREWVRWRARESGSP